MYVFEKVNPASPKIKTKNTLALYWYKALLKIKTKMVIQWTKCKIILTDG